MRNLTFDFFDDSGMPPGRRILMFYSFETDDNLSRSGILHYHLGERRFVGPCNDSELRSRDTTENLDRRAVPVRHGSHPSLTLRLAVRIPAGWHGVSAGNVREIRCPRPLKVLTCRARRLDSGSASGPRPSTHQG